ncbi:MAG: aminoacyl-tRNA hydrolase [Methylobacteriaceae bacterium]|jgi:PTH1 family peptidyl-tRNA hydrolase|nr:aminoacyl-tRNA hydrolase [Methylobacteriaceae bacterium]
MQLIVGLGNPGSRYAHNRHNIGFMCVDAVARRWNASPWRRRFHGETADAVIGDEKVLLLKPQTYMNESGHSVAEAQNFFKIPLNDVTVFYDELDLPPGKMRVKTGGGTAGHNGLRSITAQCGSGFRRVRLGIGHPVDRNAVTYYVLGDFTKGEREWVEDITRFCADAADLLVAGREASFQNKVHLAMEAEGWQVEKQAVLLPKSDT